MIRTRLLLVAGALFAAACERGDLTGPQATRAPLSLSKVGEECTIDIGATEHPLPALHVLETLLGVAANVPGSSVNCGQVRSLDAKMELIAKALDQNPPDFAVACGVSGALVNELNALVRNGQLPDITFPPPAPGAPTNLLGVAEDLSEHWCEAKRGELVGPR